MIDCNVRDLRWHDRAHTMVECVIDWKGHIKHMPEGEHPFIAWRDDLYDHGREIFERAIAGEFGRIAEWGTQP